MSNISDQIAADMIAAMRERNKIALNTLRAVKTAISNAAIEKGGAGTALSDSEVTGIIRKQIKQRQDAAEQYTQAGREELAETERLEITVLEHYLPQPLSEEEVDSIITSAIEETGASGRQDMGKVMKLVQEKTSGRADGKVLAQKVSQKLA